MNLDELNRFLVARGFTLHYTFDYMKYPPTFDWALCDGEQQQPLDWGSDLTQSAMIDHVLRAPHIYPASSLPQVLPGFGMQLDPYDSANLIAHKQ